MTNKWSIEIQNENIDRFIKDHSLDIHNIRTQPFLWNDIRWEHTDEGWVISIYPRMYYEGPVEESILHALSVIFRQQSRWFLETPADEFNQLTKEFLS